MLNGFVDIICVDDIVFRIPIEYYFSLANSPYYAHRYFRAVDVYPPRGENIVLSPFSGELIYYRVVGGEHVLGFQVGEHYVRVLHVKPLLDVGDEVRVGGVLGELATSPFFHYWTDKHMHLEVRRRPEFLRASGGVKLSLCKSLLDLIGSALESNTNEFSGEVSGEIVFFENNRYVLVKPKYNIRGYTTPLQACFNDKCGFIDGGIPHYGHGILVTTSDSRGGISEVIVKDTVLGVVDDYYGYGFYHFSITGKSLRIFVGDIRVKGVGLYIGDPYLKIIPLDWASFPYREGDVVEIKFTSKGV